MPHSYNKIWIHAIWATKNREPIIDNYIERILYKQIEIQFQEMGCIVNIINGTSDHIHCLFLLSPQKSVMEVIKQVKGSSSHFINDNELLKHRFSWQRGFSAFSVSKSMVNKVFLYIKSQKVHHSNKSFKQELKEILKLNELKN